MRLLWGIVGLGIGSFSSAEVVKSWERPLAPGMTFRMEVEANPARTIYGIKYDPRVVRAESRLIGGTIYEPGPFNGRGTVSQLVKESNAQAGFNGDFFQWTPDPGGAPSGFMVQRGQLVTGHAALSRGFAFAWGPQGMPSVIQPSVRVQIDTPTGSMSPGMLNGKLARNGLGLSFDIAGDVYGHGPIDAVHLELIGSRPILGGLMNARVLRRESGATRVPVAGGTAVLAADGTAKDSIANLKPGDAIRINITLDGMAPGLTEAMGGGPHLLKAGQYVGPTEGPDAVRHPRTAVGTTTDGYVWSIVIDGRQSMSVGTTLTETAAIMKRWGCMDALNLDGGGSSTLHALGVTLNRPSAGSERTVANGVVLYTQSPVSATAPSLTLQVPEMVPLGPPVSLKVLLGPNPAPADRTIWTAQGAAWIDQDGMLHPVAEGMATVTSLIDGRSVSSSIRVVSPKEYSQRAFRTLPYLQEPGSRQMRVTWFSVNGEDATLELPKHKLIVKGKRVTELGYSPLEETQRAQYPDMRPNLMFKHSVLLTKLKPGKEYPYTVKQGVSQHSASFKTLPDAKDRKPMRFVVFADSETEPEGRTTFRPWSIGTQAPGSTGRPSEQPNYLVTETVGFQENLKIIAAQKPDAIFLAGDIVQGGGLQRAWDEFFRHTAGAWDDVMSKFPLIASFGNWECFGAANGGYDPEAIWNARRKFLAYFDGPSNGTAAYQDAYHRLDLGPVTLITLDSSNGLPDNTDGDTNRNIDAAVYPGTDLPDINPGSPQYKWAEKQLKDARAKGQIIFVQFHHIPYSSGGHSLPLTAPGSSGQAGLPMRAYTPMFQKYGVSAVFCGHNESFERSLVDGVMFYDAGVAGDGLGYSLAETDARFKNPFWKWVAHVDSAEQWKGRQLLDGGKHYGHLQVDLEPEGKNWKIALTPVYAFPVTNEQGRVTRFERRVYQDVVRGTIENGKVRWATN